MRNQRTITRKIKKIVNNFPDPEFYFALFFRNPGYDEKFKRITGSESVHYRTVQAQKQDLQSRNHHTVYQIKKLTEICICGKEYYISLHDFMCLECRLKVEIAKQDYYILTTIEMR